MGVVILGESNADWSVGGIRYGILEIRRDFLTKILNSEKSGSVLNVVLILLNVVFEVFLNSQ